MATTDSRTGFRLPWSTDQRQASEPAESSESADSTEPAATESMDSGAPTEPAVSVDTSTDTPADTDAAATPDPAIEPAGAATPPAAAAPPTSSAPSRKPNKFLADLTKAMQAAAEAAREDSIARFSADAKTFVEQIHTRSAEESADLRHRADDDINQIRDWSKAEIARIREETEERIADRRNRLERETETHAAQIEHEIERVQGRVTDFEAEMARFFERLLAEDDPTRFAALAENLPEPPSFDVAEALAEAATWTAPAEEPAPSSPEPAVEAASDVASPDPWAGATWSADEADMTRAADAADETDATDTADATDAPHSFVDPEAALAAIQAAAEAAEATEAAEPDLQSAIEPSESTADPRLAMLGLDPDFAAAEAEAFAIDATAAQDEEIPPIGEEALAARLAGFGPAAEADASTESQVTRVVVLGLVSVASIAGFKRHLGRLPGVQAVGVSSGPDGEFVFAVSHDPGLVLAETVPTLPGFQARVTGTEDDTVRVTAHDPESDA